jgi:hypothetical protein
MSGYEDETRFIERLRSRDERAFNELVKLYERRIFGLLLRMIGQRDEARTWRKRCVRFSRPSERFAARPSST